VGPAHLRDRVLLRPRPEAPFGIHLGTQLGGSLGGGASLRGTGVPSFLDSPLPLEGRLSQGAVSYPVADRERGLSRG
jgi:hypothetical protein